MAAAVALSSRPRSSSFWVLLGGGAAFFVLTLAVVVFPTVPGDGTVREWLLGIATPPVVRTLKVINEAGSWKVLLPASLLNLAVTAVVLTLASAR